MFGINNQRTGVLIVKGSGQTLSNNTKTNINFSTASGDILIYDTHGFYSVDFPDRLTIPHGLNGVYYACAGIKYTQNTTSDRHAYIDWRTRLGALQSIQAQQIRRGLANDHTVVTCSIGPIPMADKEYLTLAGFQLSGTSLPIIADEERSTFFSLTKIF